MLRPEEATPVSGSNPRYGPHATRPWPATAAGMSLCWLLWVVANQRLKLTPLEARGEVPDGGVS